MSSTIDENLTVSDGEPGEEATGTDANLLKLPSKATNFLKGLVKEPTETKPKRKKKRNRGKKCTTPEAKMVVPITSRHYKMNHSNRGIAVIFNQESFTIKGFSNRDGTNVDRDYLKATFRRLGFQVKVHNNRSRDSVLALVNDYAQLDYSDSDCFVMCYLSHGDDNGVIYATDGGFMTENLWQPFAPNDCPSLAGKPKLFFFQACKGSKLDGGVRLVETDSRSSYRIPLYADFLIAYSTMPGYLSWRNSSRGSWFVQALCDELNQNADKYDLLTMMTFVNRRVAVGFESHVPTHASMDKQKQIPCVTSMLTRLVEFTKPVDEGRPQPKGETKGMN